MRFSGERSVATDSDIADCSDVRHLAVEGRVSDTFSGDSQKRKSAVDVRAAVVELSCIGPSLISRASGFPCDYLRLATGRVYNIGRNPRLCDFVVNFSSVSRRHCGIYLDGIGRRIFIVDGDGFGDRLTGKRNRIEKQDGEKSEEEETSRGSLNGVFVNGVRCIKGDPVELFVGDEVSLVCAGSQCNSHCKIGFVISSVVFQEEENGNLGKIDWSFSPRRISCSASCSSGQRIFARRTCAVSRCSSTAMARAKSLLGRCRKILLSADPIACILRCPFYLRPLVGAPLASNCRPISEMALVPKKPENSLAAPECSNILPVQEQESLARVFSNNECSRGASVPAEHLPEADDAFLMDKRDDWCTASLGSVPRATVPPHPPPSNIIAEKASSDLCTPILEKSFCLNRLGSSLRESTGHGSDISLTELLYPVQSILRIFVATFTSDIKWFVSHCQIPCLMPVTVACHDTERCWSSKDDRRTLIPYSEFPNVEVVFPPFPESIAFGKDRKKQGIACHHPKLIFVQRQDRIRVVISSANLVPKQWTSITNTVWWQDFPRRSSPDYMSLFTRIIDYAVKSDFAAQLAGFMACLVNDVPSQAHWISELTKYDFEGASGYLITSIPGIHSYELQRGTSMNTFSMDDRDTSRSRNFKYLATVEASVVGLSYFLSTKSDSKGQALKKLAAVLSNSRVNACEMMEIVLRRNTNVAADPNAVSVLVPDTNKLAGADCIQFGFLPRNVAKWVSPLWDGGFFTFSGYISPKEVLAAAIGGDNKRVQLILHVSQGPSFSDIAKMVNNDCIIGLCSLVASMERCIGLSRLYEVVGQYSWPESLETDFVYAASSIGSSVSPQFLAAFSAAAGKKSVVLSESEESDPEWGRWTASQELKNPSLGIVFPTIERAKNAVSGISPSRQILCFSERTWLKLKSVGMLHDAVPHPPQRMGHPMHIKVARRRFKSRSGSSSFGWVYSGSHNFSPAAWGRPISSRSDKKSMKLHVCNYELGILFVVPPGENTCGAKGSVMNLDDIELPFVTPAPKYKASDRPATKQAMREVAAKLNSIVESELSEVPHTEVADEMAQEEELVEPTDCIVENDEERAYANKLWSEVDSSSSS